MHAKRLVGGMAILFIAAMSHSLAQWVQVGSPIGGGITDLAVAPNGILWVGAELSEPVLRLR